MENWLLQNQDGSFTQKEVDFKTNPNALEEDAGTLLFDADNDGDLDLYLARGSGQYPEKDTLYRECFLCK